jgi:hypothetical protein
VRFLDRVFGRVLGGGRKQRYDAAPDVDLIKQRLVDEGQPAWAEKLDDVIAAGATGTEIVMGIRWVLSNLLTDRDVQVSKETRRLAAHVIRRLNETLDR